MSKTYTSKPTVTNARGRGTRKNSEATRPTGRETSPTRAPPPRQPLASRGRGRGVTTNGRGGVSSVRGRGMDAPQPPQEQDEPPSQEQRVSYQGGFTMITPNEKKRQAISEQARREQEQYDNHKQQQKLGHVSYVGTPGGGQITMAESRQRMIDGERFGKIDKLKKQQQYKDERKRKEESELEKKKLQQRMKAESNKQREASRQEQDHFKYDEDRRRKNEAFLSKLESQSRRPGASTTGSVISNDNSPLRLAGPVTSQDSQDQRSYEYLPAIERLQLNNPPGGQSSQFTDYEAAEGQSSQLETLQAMFPSYSPEVLSDILIQTDNNVDQAVQLLTQ
ncbi:epithelial-stromal interaction protein 1-like [Mizuhopecten yessoensis]|uniref:Reticulocyte-binding protein 2-like a n=1 Tax=Mizuhopecten yessoensis TaxID=6573 RepID=A0A210PWM2_MIZYE|nr:epithelial-stromal interaction protein 1-like [Mizuhopecten yessoensis]OWF40907.1 Reticulocyte-binding protein 2-like a [Mizuhopecten yessoensis]